MSDIIRDDSKMQSKSLLPAKEQIPSTLALNATSGLETLHEECRTFEEAINQTGYLTGIVLANKCPPNSTNGKSKYTLPHLNMEPGRELEDYLIYVALDDPASRMSTQDPEQIFLEMSKLSSGPQSKFKFDKNNPKHIEIWKKYMSSMVQHVTLAPKYTNSIFSDAPASGTRVRVYLFQPTQISSGTTIDGLYEKEYDTSIFNQGYQELKDFFKSFNQMLFDAASAMEKALNGLAQNIPSFQPSTAPSNDSTQTAGSIVGDIGQVSDSTWPPRDVVSEYIGNPSNPSAEIYNNVINQFNVDTNPRYIARIIPGYSKKVTFCNIFVADVTWAMGTALPWQIDENGNPQPMSAKFQKGWSQLGVDGMLNWLNGRGKDYNWKEVQAQEAQDNANKGLATVAIYFGARRDGRNVHHVGLVRPGIAKVDEDGPDPRSAQAGFSDANSGGRNDIPISAGFGSNYSGFPKYFTCFNSNRYVELTQEQQERFDTTTGNVQFEPEKSIEQVQENPQETSEEQPLEQ